MHDVRSFIMAYLPQYRGKDATMKKCPKLLDFGHSCFMASSPLYGVGDAVKKASSPVYGGGDAMKKASSPVYGGGDATMHETINGNSVMVSCISDRFTRVLMNAK